MSDTPARSDFNAQVVEEFRANGGKVGGPFEGMPMALLHTTGAKSGQPRLNPLAYRQDGDNVVVFASKGGAPTHPDWYRNLVANPDVEVEVGSERFRARARVAQGDERARIWSEQTRDMPQFGEYESKTQGRQIHVVVLERI